MASTHATLDAASSERKARLAKLASLKRKQPGSDITIDTTSAPDTPSDHAAPSKTDVYLSGRNYDPQTRGPRLGFENVPSSNTTTLEQQAERITLNTAEQAAKDEVEAEKGIDLFKLQPKKPNWDLKRDLAEKMKILDVRTQNAIARLVRERIEKSKKEALQEGKGKQNGGAEDQGEEVGLDGSTLVQGVHLREHEEQEDERREKERDEEDGIA
jgi:coiled-coil domain-containing protein 12